jgi:hypothetical protein
MTSIYPTHSAFCTTKLRPSPSNQPTAKSRTPGMPSDSRFIAVTKMNYWDSRQGSPTTWSLDFPSNVYVTTLTHLVTYLHGTAGCLTSGLQASGYGLDGYHALYSTAPDKIHIVTVDYRGYGLNSDTPSEGLLLDAIALTKWAMNITGIPASRIVVFAQPRGTAITISLLNNLATQSPPVSFAGTILAAILL